MISVITKVLGIADGNNFLSYAPNSNTKVPRGNQRNFTATRIVQRGLEPGVVSLSETYEKKKVMDSSHTTRREEKK